MLAVSNDYKDAITADSRQVSQKIEFEILPVGAAEDATATVTSETAFSKKDQLYNSSRLMTRKYSTMEDDYLDLSGGFGLPPEAGETGFEVGWVGDELSLPDGFYSHTNIVSNGDFANTTGYLTGSCVLTAASNTMTATGNGASQYVDFNQITSTLCAAGNIIYVSIRARVTNSVCSALGITMFGSGGGVANMIEQSSPIQNNWYSMSGRLQLTGAFSGYIRPAFYSTYASAAVANGKVMETQEALSVDLTSKYGAGNEPSKATMDALIALTGWFDGNYRTQPKCTTNFTGDHSSIGLTVTFDTLLNEYAEDFTVVYKDSGGATLHTETVTSNTLATYILEQNVSNFRSVEIEISKWANAYRRARIVEVDFGIIEQYTGEEIIRTNMLEQLSTLTDEIYSNELYFTLDNQDKAFNLLNPSGIYPYLQRRQKIRIFTGFDYDNGNKEYASLGVFYLTTWKTDEKSLTASFEARDILDILSQDEFAGATYVSKSLKYIAEDIFSGAGITNYSVDVALDSIVVSVTLDAMDYRTALQKVAFAGQAILKVNRNDAIIIERLSSTDTGEEISFDNAKAAPKIELEKLINTVYVIVGATTYTYTASDKPSTEPVAAVTIENELITTEAHAEDVAEWVLSECAKRFLYESNWAQNPSFEVGDIITIEDEFGENYTARITRNEFSYNGALSGKTNAKGGGA